MPTSTRPCRTHTCSRPAKCTACVYQQPPTRHTTHRKVLNDGLGGKRHGAPVQARKQLAQRNSMVLQHKLVPFPAVHATHVVGCAGRVKVPQQRREQLPALGLAVCCA